MAMAVLPNVMAPVAVAHSLRVAIVVIVIPLALTYSGIALEAAEYRPNVALAPYVLALWFA